MTFHVVCTESILLRLLALSHCWPDFLFLVFLLNKIIINVLRLFRLRAHSADSDVTIPAFGVPIGGRVNAWVSS